jgi:hypothetical protein
MLRTPRANAPEFTSHLEIYTPAVLLQIGVSDHPVFQGCQHGRKSLSQRT